MDAAALGHVQQVTADTARHVAELKACGRV